MPSALPDKGDPNGVITPAIEGTPVPVTEHEAVLPEVETDADGLEEGSTTKGVSVIRGANGFGASATDGGLSPPTPTSVEPMGIPALPTDETEPAAVGDKANAGPGNNDEAPPPLQPPEADPDMPPPSNRLVLPSVDAPVFMELPDVEALTPAEVGRAEPPAQVVMPPNPGNVPDIVGLTPDDASSVAPSGILVCGTGEPGPTPSGDVMPSAGPGKTLAPSWADAEPQLKRAAAVAAITRRVVMSPASFGWSARRALMPCRLGPEAGVEHSLPACDPGDIEEHHAASGTV